MQTTPFVNMHVPAVLLLGRGNLGDEVIFLREAGRSSRVVIAEGGVGADTKRF